MCACCLCDMHHTIQLHLACGHVLCGTPAFIQKHGAQALRSESTGINWPFKERAGRRTSPRAGLPGGPAAPLGARRGQPCAWASGSRPAGRALEPPPALYALWNRRPPCTRAGRRRLGLLARQGGARAPAPGGARTGWPPNGTGAAAPGGAACFRQRERAARGESGRGGAGVMAGPR